MPCATASEPTDDLERLLASTPCMAPAASFGADIDEANQVMLNPDCTDECKIARLRMWASRFQPCMFGRLGAKNLGGIRYEICWINRADMVRGSPYVVHKIQQARRAWRDRASEGLAHGFLIMFNAPELAYAKPGPELVELCLALCDLYLVEHAPVLADTIYTESLPFRGADGVLTCLKGGINVFYTSAHRTSNHDRRIPGGIMISVNSPGLLANSLVKRGIAPDLASALKAVRTLAWASIGNGGLSMDQQSRRSCSWHNIDQNRAPDACPMKHRPQHVPGNFASDSYSALYHTDVLIPSKVMMDASQDRPRSDFEVWGHLDLEYLSAAEHPHSHENFGFVRGQRIDQDDKFQHAWSPVSVRDPASEAYLS